MKKAILFLGSVLLVVLPTTAQIIVWEEDFEDHGNTANGGAGRYTSDHDFHGGSNDYFGRVEGATEEYYLTNTSSTQQINSEVTYSGWNGDFFYAAEDLNDLGGTIGNPDGVDFKDLIISNINISGASAMRFKGLFATGENGPCADSAYDDADFVEVYYEVDNSGETLGMCFNADLECNVPADITNEPLYFDDANSQGGACDGDGGGGTLLTADFQEFFFLIPDGSNLDLRIRVRMDSGSEEFAFDKFQIEAEVLNIEETSLNDQIKVVPNPSQGRFELKYADGLELVEAQVYNVLGEYLESIDPEIGAEGQRLDLSGYSTGLYFLKLRTINDRIVLKRILIE